VEALMWPRWNSSVYPRMRQFEELRQFGMYHRTIQLVDGVNVVPGVFTAFRRDIALQIDGFTDGMNGEDGDFTLRFSRVGYRTHMDPKILIYEDVPSSYMELREQRLRWGRATIHNHARHGPYRAGLATSKVWFSQTHLFYTKVFSSIRVMIFFYLFLVAVFEGVYRAPILTFLGFYVVSKGGLILLDITLASGYRKIRYIPWAILIPVWGFFMAFFSVESWLSLPGRPVKLFGEKAAPISAPVIH
jgi:cellulose synthase/poly-beta-1,6-N-acetylglucosamine synthase-like glycosyltransferase